MQNDLPDIEPIIDSVLEQSAERLEVLKEIAEMERQPPEDDVSLYCRA